jgi:hypothetical protein
MAGAQEININELPPSDDSMAIVTVPVKELTIVEPKPLVVIPSKEIVIMPPKEIEPVHRQQSYYARAMPTLNLAPPPSRLAIEGPSQPELSKFCVPKELNVLPPKPNEMLTKLKTNKFGNVTCTKYKSTQRVTLDGVRAVPE